MKNNGNGIFENLKSLSKPVLKTQLTNVDLMNWVKTCTDTAPKGKRTIVITAEGLQLAYNEFGRDNFLEYLSMANWITGQSGIDFIMSLGYPEHEPVKHDGFNAFLGGSVTLNKWME